MSNATHFDTQLAQMDRRMNVNEKEKKKAEKKRKKQKEKTDKLKAEVDQLVKEMEIQYGTDPSNLKSVRLHFPKRDLKTILFEILMHLFLNLVLIFAMTGYIKWATYASIWDLVWFILGFTVIELVLKNMIHIVFQKWIIKTFGMILLLPALISLPIIVLTTQFVVIQSVVLLMVVFVLVLSFRTLIKGLASRMKRGKL